MSDSDAITEVEWVSALSREELTPGTIRGVKVDGCRIALMNVGGEILALDNACPHRGGPLAKGTIREEEIECPWHRFRFDIRSGQATMPAGQPGALTYPVRCREGTVEVSVRKSRA